MTGLQQEQRNMIMQLWHTTAKHKIKAVGAYITDLLESIWDSNGTKFLVFAHHK
jgi:hypothetical protein